MGETQQQTLGTQHAHHVLCVSWKIHCFILRVVGTVLKKTVGHFKYFPCVLYNSLRDNPPCFECAHANYVRTCAHAVRIRNATPHTTESRNTGTFHSGCKSISLRRDYNQKPFLVPVLGAKHC